MYSSVHPEEKNNEKIETTASSSGITSTFRGRIKSITSSQYFDSFILVAIILNSLLIACYDYTNVNNDYQPSASSTRNYIIDKFEIIFTAVFAVECILKIISQGFINDKNAYLRDGFNLLDFVLVIISLAAIVPGVPNLSVVRSIRVLRPLRTLSKVAGLKRVVNTLIASIGDLVNVGVLLLFILVFFTLFGVTFWRGLFHYRCRLTEFPVKMSVDCRNATDSCWDNFLVEVVRDPEAHRCLPFPNNDVTWTQSSSQWYVNGPQDCVWPIDNTDKRVCSTSSGGFGSYTCSRPVNFMSEENVSRTCGSNYDAFGNPRFVDSLDPFGFPRLQSGVFDQALNWGYTSYDNFISSFITTFQAVTLEGWTTIMSHACDAWSDLAIPVFILLVVLAGVIVLNIVLAVISNSLDKIESFLIKEKGDVMAALGSSTQPPPKDSFFRRRTQDLKNLLLPPIHSATQRKLKVITSSNMYTRFILAVILMNTIILSCDHYGIGNTFQIILDAGNFITTTIFFVDMILLNIAHGVDKYWSTPSSLFDGIIAVSSIFELILARMSEGGGSGTSAMSVFRSLRLVRLLKMVKQWKSLHSLLATMAQSASDVKSFGLLLVLFVFIYALIGMQLFANHLHFDNMTAAHVDISDPRYTGADVPRANFDDFFWSMTTVFQVLTGENWNTAMYDCWKATSIAPAYFISLITLGVFCALNLFLAILLLPFDGSELVLSNRVHPEGEPIHNTKQSSLLWSKSIATLNWLKSKTPAVFSSSRYEHICEKCSRILDDKRFDLCLTFVIICSSIAIALDDPLRDPKSSTAEVLFILNYAFTTVFIFEFLVKILSQGPSKYLQDRWNILDFSCVVASILELSNVQGGKTLRVLRAFRVLRPLKMINKFEEVKVVVDALLMSLPSVVDVGVVCALLFLVFSIFGVTYLKGTFFKCIGSSLTEEEMNLITYPKLVGKFTSTELSWLDVGLDNCGASEWGAGKLPTSRELCDCMNGDWVETIPQNFNNILNGFALLFEISTTEGWVDVMYAAIDQRGIDAQPVRDNNRLWALYFIVFLMLGAFFILELFVGVIIENFSRLREINGQGIMTEAQRQWAQTQQFISKLRPEVLLRRPEHKPRALCFDFVMNQWFDRFIATIIVANSIVIGAVSFDSSQDMTLILGMLNLAFSSIFILEAMLKLIALERLYFRSMWNRFDFIIVCGLIVGFGLQMIVSDQLLVASISSVVSLARIGRLIRLVRLVRPLRTPFNTILAVLPGMCNIGALLLLLFYVYGIIGMQLFGTIEFQGELNKQNNFQTIGQSMLLLLRFSTGENWNGFMYGLIEERRGCNGHPMYDETSPWCRDEKDYPNCTEVNGCSASSGSVFVYFYSFTIIVSYIILNMFVAVVLQAFEASSEGEILEPKDLEHFVQTWSLFDPNATWFINAAEVQSFLSRLKPPLGMAGQGNNNEALHDPCLLEISVNNKKQVNIVNVAHLLAKRIAKEKQGDSFRDLNDDHPVSCRLTRRSSLDGANTTLGDVYMDSSLVILRAVMRFKNNRKRQLDRVDATCNQP